jgi:hypothetical protein
LETDSYTESRAGPTRGPGVETREVRGVKRRPAKAPQPIASDKEI